MKTKRPRCVETAGGDSTRYAAAAFHRTRLEYQPESDLVDGEPIYDGTAELYWNNIEEMEDSFKSTIGIDAGNDADQFSDIRIHIYTEEHIIL